MGNISCRPILCWFFAVVSIAAGIAHGEATITVDASKVQGNISPHLMGTCLEDVNHEVYGGLWSQLIFGESFGEPAPDNSEGMSVSGMWRGFKRGTASGAANLETRDGFSGTQSQRLSFKDGAGEVGIENRGLNRWGISVVSGKSYDGYVWLRSETPVKVVVGLASGDGTREYASADIAVSDVRWHRYDFVLTPNATDVVSRFEIGLSSPGSALVGYAFLERGKWGRFKGLPVRRDVVEGLINEGVTAMRYGGSMVNAAGYRWKNMIGPPDRRLPYVGTWYRESSNGWGIIDFLNLCEAMGILGIPDFNINESPGDMADFVEYVNGPENSPWGRKRVADGHAKPYGVTHLELGNEERVDDSYYEKFAAIAQAVWEKDPGMILGVGDFQYSDVISDPMRITGSASKITSLAAQAKILELAKKYDAEVWFDVHVDTECPPASPSLVALPSYIDAIDKLAGGAKHHVVVFELNANNHAQRRAVANAQAIIRIERDGRLPFVSSANCLQCDGENDNGWDQGLLFLNPERAWLQPPGYALQMFSRNYQPRLISCDVVGNDNGLEAAGTVSDDGRTVVLQVVNTTSKPQPAAVELRGFDLAGAKVSVQTLDETSVGRSPVFRDDFRSHIFPGQSITICKWTH